MPQGSTQLKRILVRMLGRQAMGHQTKTTHEEFIPLELWIFPIVSLKDGLVSVKM